MKDPYFFPILIIMVIAGLFLALYEQEPQQSPLPVAQDTILKADGRFNEPVKPVVVKVRHPDRAIWCETELGPCWYNDAMGRKESACCYKWYDSEDVLMKVAR